MQYVLVALLIVSAAATTYPQVPDIYGFMSGCNYDYNHHWNVRTTNTPCVNKLYATLLAAQSSIMCNTATGDHQLFITAANSTLGFHVTAEHCYATTYICNGFNVSQDWSANFMAMLDDHWNQDGFISLTENLACVALTGNVTGQNVHVGNGGANQFLPPNKRAPKAQSTVMLYGYMTGGGYDYEHARSIWTSDIPCVETLYNTMIASLDTIICNTVSGDHQLFISAANNTLGITANQNKLGSMFICPGFNLTTDWVRTYYISLDRLWSISGFIGMMEFAACSALGNIHHWLGSSKGQRGQYNSKRVQMP